MQTTPSHSILLLSDPRWEGALTATGFVNLASRAAARDQTWAAVFYDGANLYVGFRVNQSTPITATQSANQIGFGIDDFVGVGICGDLERPFADGPLNSQWLRRFTFGVPLGSEGNASLGYRVISGTGGFATPGKNIAVALRKRFRGGDELFVDYGTPAASATLDRLIVKYLMRIGGGV